MPFQPRQFPASGVAYQYKGKTNCALFTPFKKICYKLSIRFYEFYRFELPVRVRIGTQNP